MIHSVLIINNLGLPRLVKFYTPVDLNTQSLLLKQVHGLLSNRNSRQCSFLIPPPLLVEDMEDEVIRVIYRQYATLYFVFIVDEQESELGILDLIQVFVESLDRCFDNVCELDLVFGWQVLQTVLGEIIQGGMVVETNINKIVAAVDEANKGTSDDSTISAAAKALSNASSAFQAIARDGRMWR